MQGTSCEMPGCIKHKLESRLPEEITTSDKQLTPPLWQKSGEELKSLLMKVKEESEKASFKLNIQKTKIMASGPITSRQIDEETVTDFSWAPKSLLMDYGHEIKRWLLLGRKAVTNRDSILKKAETLLCQQRSV